MTLLTFQRLVTKYDRNSNSIKQLTHNVTVHREGQLPGAGPRRHEFPRPADHPGRPEFRNEEQDLRDTTEPDAGHGQAALRPHRSVSRPLRQGPEARAGGPAARLHLQLSPHPAGPDQGPARQVDQGLQLQRRRQRGRRRAARGGHRQEKREYIPGSVDLFICEWLVRFFFRVVT